MTAMKGLMTLAAAGLLTGNAFAQGFETTTKAEAQDWTSNLYSNYELRKYDRYYGTADEEATKLNNLQHRLYLGTKLLDDNLNVYVMERYEKASVEDGKIRRARPYFVAEYSISGDNYEIVPYLWVVGNAQDKGTNIIPTVYGKVMTDISTGAGELTVFGSGEASIDYLAKDEVMVPDAESNLDVEYDRPTSVNEYWGEALAGVKYAPNFATGLTFEFETAINRALTTQYIAPDDSTSEEAEVADAFAGKTEQYNRLTIGYKFNDRLSIENETYQYLSNETPLAVRTSDIAVANKNESQNESYMNLLKVNYTIL